MYDSILVDTDTPVAFDSPDHLHPWGTARDNSMNLRFNEKVIRLFGKQDSQLKVLDLGCSGGGFVRSLLEKGHFSVGIEGSDYSKKTGRAEWHRLSNKFLFTADITREFSVKGNLKEKEEVILFDLITSWEVMEHLPKDRLEVVCKNINKHLSPNGLAIVSVSPNEEFINGKKLHLTVQDKSWWIEMFKNNGLNHIEALGKYFNTQFIRGPKQNAEGSFILFLSREPFELSRIPSISIKEWLIDRWLFSKAQKALKKLCVG